MITFENITKVYKRGARPASDQVDLNIERGEFVFSVGTSDSGKSTFLSLVLYEYGVIERKIVVLGKDLGRISRWKMPQLRHQLGVVFQDFRLLENKSVYDNVVMALQVIGKPHRVIRRAVPEMSQMVGSGGKDRRFPHELSGGGQQRVTIAYAMVSHPPILLADKPAGNLDPVTSLGITCLSSRTNRAGTTVVMATHDEEIVSQVRRRIIKLDEERMVHDQDRGVYGGLALHGEIALDSTTGKSGETARPDHETTTAEGI